MALNPEELLDHKLNLEIFSNLSEGEYTDLKLDIEKRGIQDPLHVRKIVDGFQVICGHQRKKIAVELGLKVVPCIVRDDLKEEWMVEEQLIRDNLNRRHLKDPEIARVSMRLLLIEKEKAKQRQGERTDITSAKNFAKVKDKKPVRSSDVVAKQFGKKNSEELLLLNFENTYTFNLTFKSHSIPLF